MTKYRIVKDGNGRYFVEEYAFVFKKNLKPGESFYSDEREWQKCTKEHVSTGVMHGVSYIPEFITKWGARRFMKKLIKQDEWEELAKEQTVIEEYGDD